MIVAPAPALVLPRLPLSYRLHIGDVIAVLLNYPADFFDGMITDPPYGLSDLLTVAETRACLLAWLFGQPYRPARRGGFQGREWDAFIPGPEYWREVLRVLKPGAHVVVFAGGRTRWLMELAMVLAGFELRDAGAWLYSTGSPMKSMSIDLAIDEFHEAAADRPVLATIKTNVGLTSGNYGNGGRSGDYNVTGPATLDAQDFTGYGTAPKPAFEPYIIACKPNTPGGFAVNGILQGVAGLNLGACRLPGGADVLGRGRFPSNVMLDEGAAAALEAQVRGASAFYYIAKATKGERNAGLDHLEDRERKRLNPGGLSDDPRWAPTTVKNNHPTVKPIALTTELSKIILPPARLIRGERYDKRRLLVPFSGSFSDAIGGALAGWDDITGIEIDADMEPVSHGRMRHHAELAGIPIDRG